jgi:4'-phosphopantetheinyl transferase
MIEPGLPRRGTWWLARGESDLPGDTSWLCDAEVAYVEAQRFAKRRTEFLVARWTAKQAIRTLLSLPDTPASLQRIAVRHAATGAPRVYLDGQPVDCRISLTDRAGWAVCLVGFERTPVGCDLELVEPRSDRFVGDYFTVAERDYVQSAEQHRDVNANLIWSAKESGLKVLETGLRRDTRSVEVRLAAAVEGWSRLTVHTASGQVLPGWWQRFGAFLLTVAASESLASPISLDDSSPLQGAEPVHSWMRRPLADRPPGARSQPSRVRGRR